MKKRFAWKSADEKQKNPPYVSTIRRLFFYGIVPAADIVEQRDDQRQWPFGYAREQKDRATGQC